MLKRLIPGASMAAILFTLVLGVGAARADNGDILYRQNGTQMGVTTVVPGGGSMQATVTLQNATPNTTYVICITDPGDVAGFICQPPPLIGVSNPYSSYPYSAYPYSASPYTTSPYGGTSCSGQLISYPCYSAPTGISQVNAGPGGIGYATGNITTDANGNGNAVLTVPGTLPVAVVTVTNSTLPSDAAQAVVNTGASAPISYCPVSTGYGYGTVPC